MGRKGKNDGDDDFIAAEDLPPLHTVHLCKSYEQKGSCTYGEDCKMQHTGDAQHLSAKAWNAAMKIARNVYHVTEDNVTDEMISLCRAMHVILEKDGGEGRDRKAEYDVPPLSEAGLQEVARLPHTFTRGRLAAAVRTRTTRNLPDLWSA